MSHRMQIKEVSGEGVAATGQRRKVGSRTTNENSRGFLIDLEKGKMLQ